MLQNTSDLSTVCMRLIHQHCIARHFINMVFINVSEGGSRYSLIPTLGCHIPRWRCPWWRRICLALPSRRRQPT